MPENINIRNFLIKFFEQKANEALVEQLYAHNPGTLPDDLNANNIVGYLGSNEVNAWQHAYVSGILALYDPTNSVLYMGYLKELFTPHQWSTDTLRDLYNNLAGVELADDCTNFDEFAKRLFEKQYDSPSGKIISLKSDPYLIVNPDDDPRINDPQIFLPLLQLIVPIPLSIPMRNILEDFAFTGGAAPIQSDPLLIDLNGDGIKTTNTKMGNYFDHKSDGFKELSSWVSDDDGILFIDKNSNGKIDNGSEIFGENYIKSNGQNAISGFDALSDLDTNNDGIINNQDSDFSNIRIIKGDGTILTLEEAGINSLDVNYQKIYKEDENGNTQIEKGTSTKTDGTNCELGSFILKTDDVNSVSSEYLEVSSDVEILPNLRGYGNVYDLHQAIMRDETGTLKNLVENFISTNTSEEARSDLLDQILFKWANCENVSENSRGLYINAKELEVLEKFLAKKFFSNYDYISDFNKLIGGSNNSSSSSSGVSSTTQINPSNPNPNAANILKSIYQDLKTYIYAELMGQSICFDLINLVEVSNNGYDLTAIVNKLKQELQDNPILGKERILQFSKIIKGLQIEKQTNFFDPKNDNCFYTIFTKNDRELKWLIDTIGKIPFIDETCNENGSSSDDSYRMDESGHFHALSGDDVTYGSDEDDHFSMCKGNDLVDAGAGNDVIDTHADNDTIFAGAGNDTIHAGDGNDVIFGEDGDDVIYPDHSDDSTCYGEGDDIIRGGKGNDTIISVKGNDTFIFNLGDGQDVVIEKQGVDTFYFGNGITWDDLIFERSENDMIIKINNTTDKITVKDWFETSEDGVYGYDNNKIEIFEFADGSKHYKDEITVGDNTESITYNMDEIGDWVQTASGYKAVVNVKEGWNDINAGLNSDDTYVIDRQGADVQISDYSGNDTIKFGEGISLARTFFAYNQDHIEIWFEDYEAHIRLRGDGSNYTKFKFADGTVITDLSNYFERTVSYVDHIMGERERELTLLGDDAISVTGNNLDNRIITNKGNSTINAGKGNDEIISTLGGDNTYIINLDDGNDRIVDVGGTDTIRFGEGITIDNINFLKNLETNDLEIWFNVEDGSENWITIENFFGSDENMIENFVFSDGSVITNVEQYLNAYGSKENGETLTLPDNIREGHIRGEAHTTVIGNNMDNHINGGLGDNTFIGGRGNDFYWDDQGGNDRFIYNIGDGHDGIANYGGLDVVIFGEGITKENIRFERSQNELVIWFDGIEESSLTINDYFSDPNAKVELFKFADGSVIDDITQYLIDSTQEENTDNNNDSNVNQNNENDEVVDTIENNTSIETVNPIYEYNIGDGFNNIANSSGIETIKFGAGLTLENLWCLNRNGKDLEIQFNGVDGYVVIENYFTDEENRIGRFEFADGSVIEDILQYVKAYGSDGSIVLDGEYEEAHLRGTNNSYALGTSANEYFIGNAGNNTFAGGGGDDSFYDEYNSNEMYIYNVNNGHDNIYDCGGVDRIKFGKEIYSWNTKFEQIGNNLEISFYDREGGITIEDYFSDDDHKIEFFEFDNGEILTDITDRLIGLSVNTNYTMTEDSVANVIRMNGNSNISVTGNSANNIIMGNSGNNTFEGKGGDDELIDHEGGDDTYIYNIGDGYDTIDDIGGYDTIKFGESVTLENLALMQTENDLNIWFHNIEGSGLSIKDFFSNPEKKIERFELADGTVITDISNYLTAIGSDECITLPEGISQAHLWGENNTSATGNDMDNWIGGNSGDNTIIGGKGDDYLYDDQGGNDTFIYNLGDGHDCIVNYGGYDTIKFGEGISANNLIFIMNDGDLLINFVDNDGNMINGSIRIEGHFFDNEKKVEKLEFADGSTIVNPEERITQIASENDIQNNWNFSEINAWGNSDIRITGSSSDETIFGNSGNNYIDPNGGNDNIYDTEGGDDTYIYNFDCGNKYIVDIGGNDTIKLGEGLNINNTFFSKSGDNLILHFPHTGEGMIQIENYFSNEENKIEKFEFADGTVITDVSNLITGTASYGDVELQENQTYAHLLGTGDTTYIGNNSDYNRVYGNSGNNTYDGRGGYDHIQDKAGGNDTYIYNVGYGGYYIADIGGDDTIRFGNGISIDDLRFSHIGNNLQIFIDIEDGNGGDILIENYFKSDLRKIEKIEFADGTIITDVTPYITGITIDSNYTIEENSQIRDLYLKGNNDISVVGNSQDNHFEGNSGNNTFEGKGGNDFFWEDQGGNDTYIFNFGDNYDYIVDKGGNDTIRFGEGATTSNIRFLKDFSSNNLELWFATEEDSQLGVTIENYFGDDDSKIENFVFADGSTITDLSDKIWAWASNGDVTLADGIVEAHLRGEDNTTATGNDLDNWMCGNSGNNTFIGGRGNDFFWEDQGGNDTYIYNIGDGFDTIEDYGGIDTIKFGEGITTENIRFMEGANHFVVWFEGIEENITINNHMNDDNNKIERFELADGTVITDVTPYLTGIRVSGDYTLAENTLINTVRSRCEEGVTLIGNSSDNVLMSINNGNSTLQGKGGDDVLCEFNGNDTTYIYNTGDGNDRIEDHGGNDVISFGEGITANDLTFNVCEDDADSLEINIGENGKILILNYFADEDWKIEKIRFFDGSEMTNLSSYLPDTPTDEEEPTIPPVVEPIEEEEPTIPTSNYDINLINQETVSYGIDSNVFIQTDFEPRQREDILLSMVS